MKPDTLFRNKLENFQRPAPAGAWDKIEQNLEARKTPVVWMRVAAGIAVLATATIVLWPSQKGDQFLTETSKPVTPKQEVVQPVIVDTTQQQQGLSKNAVNNFTASQETKKVEKKQRIASSEQPSEKNENKTVPDPVKEELLIAEVTTPAQQNTVPAQQTVESQKSTIAIASTTITYSADEVNAKFLKKKITPQATPEPADASTVQKLIGLAYAAKNSDADLGNLRQKKDDLLALNFRNKKGEN